MCALADLRRVVLAVVVVADGARVSEDYLIHSCVVSVISGVSRQACVSTWFQLLCGFVASCFVEWNVVTFLEHI